MRPLRLEVKGFTAFRDPADLDFTDLDVFAIAGPTGSGKSSLLDAMTYALYGRVERVGDRVSQLISQGQPRMAVTLEFEVGRDRYRVTRSTPAKGATKILLQRREPGGEWAQAGEGADRVREVEPRIVRAIGLTYDGFTRSVLLPQGKFAEFLVGDPKKRRDILTELLGLTLFRRMAERAGGIAKESTVRARTMTDLLERDYADVTPEVLKAARAAAKDAGRREKALARAAERIVEILGRWEDARRSLDDLRACAAEASGSAEGAAGAAEELASLADRLHRAARAAEEQAEASQASQRALVAAQAALQESEAAGGTVGELGKLQVRAHSLAEAMRNRQNLAARQARSVQTGRALLDALGTADRSMRKLRETTPARLAAVDRATAALEEARHADLVAAVAAGLKAGDPCPVCGLPLEKAPKRSAGNGLEKAAKSADAARTALEQAGKDLSNAERTADAARRDVEAAATDQARLSTEIEDLDRVIVGDHAVLTAVLGEPLPADPGGAIEERLAELHRLDRAERDAARAVAEAAQAVLKADQDRDRVAMSIDRVRERLATDHQALFDRAARAIGKKAAPTRLPAPPPAEDPAGLARFAEKLGEALATFAQSLRHEVEERSSMQGRLLQEANERAQGLVEPGRTLEELAGSVSAACRSATAEVATRQQRADDLAEKLDRKRQLLEEVRLLDDRARVFKALALELRADRLIAFLQAEALHVLAAAGSERLAGLSEGRYRIVCRDDEFFVVDTWNGDEERSVRTLSGGETFLASLSLALALSEQVRSLSVTDRARLDSLFLDEGFGTLDPDSLRTVVDAIEQLGGDGRLVGVVTHVRELAEQFPRIEVTKSPRGSRLALVG